MNDYFGAGLGGIPQSTGQYGPNFNWNTSPIANRKTYTPVDQMVMMMLGNKLHPLPEQGAAQGVYDAYWRRQRDMELLHVRNNAVANMLPFKKAGGLNQDSLFFQVGASMVNNPDGFFAKTMSPMIGGNPIRAQMGMYANMRGMSMSTFGTTQDMTARDVGKMQDILYGNFYNQREIGTQDLKDSKTAMLAAARKRGASADLAGRMDGFFKENGEIDTREGGKYKKFTEEADAIKGIEKLLTTAKMDTQENKQKATEAAKTFLTGVTDTTAKDKISKAFADAIKQGDVNAFRKTLGTASIDVAARQLALHSELKIGDKRPTSLNFANSYGFNMEDLTSAFYSSAQYKLLGNRKDQYTAFGDFTKGSNVGALDAARGLFGNDKTGKELMGDVNQFLGVSHVDFSNEGDTGKFEGLTRNIKSLARNANVSLDMLLEAINQGKAFASNTQGLQHMGGMEIGQLAVDAGHELSALTSTLSNGSIRRMGGTQGAYMGILRGKLASRAEPISQQLAAMYTLSQGDERGQQMVLDYAKDPSRNKNIMGLNKFQKEFSSATGRNYYDVVAFATTNEMAAKEGMRLAGDKGLGDAGAAAAMQTYRQNVFFGNGGRTGRGTQALADFDKIFSGRADVDKYLEIADRDLNSTNKGQAGRIRDLLANSGSTSVEGFMSSSDENKSKNGELHRAINGLQASLDSRIAQRRDVSGRMTYGGDAFLRNTEGLVRTDDTMVRERMGGAWFNRNKKLNDQAAYIAENSYDVAYMKQANPGFRAQYEASRKRTESDAALEKTVNKGLGFLNAPIATQLFNKVLDGSIKKDGISAILEPLGIGPGSEHYNNLVKATEGISKTATATSYADLAASLGKTNEEGKQLSNFSSASKRFGITKEQWKALSENDIGKAASILNTDRAADRQIKESDVKKLHAKAKFAKEQGLLDGYEGEYNLAGMRQHFAKRDLGFLREELVKPKIADLEKLYVSKLDGKVAGVGVSSQQKATAKALRDAKVTDFASLKEVMDGTGLDDKNQLTPKLKKMAQQLGLDTNKAADTRDAIRKRVGELDITKYSEQADSVKAQAKNAGKSDNQIQTEILTKMQELPAALQGIISAIERLSSTTA